MAYFRFFQFSRISRTGHQSPAALGALCLLGGSLAGTTAEAHHPQATSKREPARRPVPESSAQSAGDPVSFQKVTLNGAPGEPIALAVLPDGRTLHTTRGGKVWLHDPSTGFNTVAAELAVYSHDEEGLQGIAIDPGFERNHWVYLYYSPVLDTPTDDPSTPLTNEGDAPAFGTAQELARFRGHMQLSRFKFRGSALDLRSEQRILQVPTDRGICCHVGGDIDFDAQGNLLLSTGDDTNPFESDSFTPIDIRRNRSPAFDAQRSSANTNDLRGKLLRIQVLQDGRYRIPQGNLFAPGTPKARPEIYAMGLRNPFRFSVDRERDLIYLADYSPDASSADPARGPAGQGKWAIIREPGNYGWPYCATASLPYHQFDFETRQSGQPFDCSSPVNDSPSNTGRRRLPAVVQPEVWYGAGPSAEFPALGTGGVAPMAGPAYRYQPELESDRKWPRALDGVPIFYEWARDALFAFSLTARHGARPSLAGIERLLPEIPLANPMDMAFGPDGALYLLEYGDGYFSENPEAQLSRIQAVRGNSTPVATLTPSALWGQPPLEVMLTTQGSHDPDGDELSFAWDFDSDGVVDATGPSARVVFEQPGTQSITLRVTDSTGRFSTDGARVIVGNTPPVLTFTSPAADQLVHFGDTVDYQVSVNDDGPVDCSRVEVQYVLVHDSHGHSLSTARGCSGRIVTALDSGHDGASNIYGGLYATYSDRPLDSRVSSLSGSVFAPLLTPELLALFAAEGSGAPAESPDSERPDAGAPSP